MTFSEEYEIGSVSPGTSQQDLYADIAGPDPDTSRCSVFMLRDGSASMGAERERLANRFFRSMETALDSAYDTVQIQYGVYGRTVDVLDEDAFYQDRDRYAHTDDATTAYREAVDRLQRQAFPEDDVHLLMASDHRIDAGSIGMLPREPATDGLDGVVYVAAGHDGDPAVPAEQRDVFALLPVDGLDAVHRGVHQVTEALGVTRS